MKRAARRAPPRTIAQALAAAGASLLFAASAAAAAAPLAVAAFEYPPIYQNAADKGLAVDLVIAAFRAVDVDVALSFLPVARMIHYLETAQTDCAIGGQVLFESSPVAAGLRASAPVLYVNQTFFYDRRRFPGGIAFSGLAQLAGRRIGVLHSSGIAKFLQHTEGLTLLPNTTHEGSARQLHAGRLDLWAIVDLTGRQYLTALFPEDVQHFEWTRGFNRGDVSLVCSRQRDADGETLRRFAEGLARIKKNGTYMAIMAKYYGGIKRISPEALPDDLR